MAWRESVLAVVAALMTATAAHGAPVIHNTRASWLAAVGGTADEFVDFNAFTVDTEFRTAPLDVGPMTLSFTGSTPVDRQIIDVPPFLFAAFDIDGTPNANLLTDTFDQFVTVTFDEPTFAWGADFGNAGIGLALNVGAAALEVSPTSNTFHGFFGFVSPEDEAVTSITFTTINQTNAFSIDNVVMENTATATDTVPEPSSVAGLLAIIGLLAYARRDAAHARSGSANHAARR